MEVFILVTCGNNPAKTTSVRHVPNDNEAYPVEFSDAVDLKVLIADEFIQIQVIDVDRSEAEIVGGTVFRVSDMLDMMSGSINDLLSLEGVSKTLMFEGDDAGELHMHLYATRLDKALPPVMP